MNLQIRRAADDDFTLFTELNNEIQTLHACHEPRLFKSTATLSLDAFQKWITHPEFGIFVGVIGEQAIGYVFCELWRQAETPYSYQNDPSVRSICS